MKASRWIKKPFNSVKQVSLSCVVSSSRWLTSSRSSFTAPTKSLPLSLIISFGTPLLLVKRGIALTKLSASTAEAVSRWMALVWRQVKRHKYPFCRLIPPPWMVLKGSAAHWWNGLKVNLSLIAGSGAITWVASFVFLFLISLRQLSAIIQNFWESHLLRYWPSQGTTSQSTLSRDDPLGE